MLFIDPTPEPGMGNSKLWRVFADTTDELRDAIREAGGRLSIKAAGTPGEHAVVTTTIKNKLRGQEADMRTLVKLIKRKSRGEPAFTAPAKSGVTFTTKPTESPDATAEPEGSK